MTQTVIIIAVALAMTSPVWLGILYHLYREYVDRHGNISQEKL